MDRFPQGRLVRMPKLDKEGVAELMRKITASSHTVLSPASHEPSVVLTDADQRQRNPAARAQAATVTVADLIAFREWHDHFRGAVPYDLED